MSDKKKDTFILKRFGKYLLLDHLVDGGMAKICRARFLDEKANKIVAIKMIQSKYNADENFIRMFMDEVKVSFGLIHPNIAQTYDTGMVSGQLYTVMEYVDGKNLKQFLDRLREKKFVFPVDVSVYIVSQVCQGLSYAHTFTDKLTGKKINIIHRDISPHNIMITYDGAVKVIDFGIAKAETNSEDTQAGTIKGKFSYLAPEYIEGLPLDSRYDQFAVGITLWELLCCRKLFKSNTDIGIIKEVQKCQVPPPSSINPNVSPELDNIVLKALNKDRNLRYDNMEQFNRALVKFLYSNYPDFNASDLSYFAQELFADVIKKDRIKLYEFGKIDIKPYLEQLPLDNSSNSDVDLNQNRKSPEQKKAESIIDLGFPEEEIKGSLQKTKTAPVVGKNEQPTLELEEPLSSGTRSRIHLKKEAGVSSNKTGITSRITRQTRVTKVSRGSQGTSVKRLKKPTGKPNRKNAHKLLRFAMLAVLGAGGYAYLNKGSIEKMVTRLRKPSSVEQTSIAEVENKMGDLILNGLSPFQVVSINGKEIQYKGLGVKLPLNQEHVLQIQEDGKEPFVVKFQLTEGQNRFVQKIPELRYIPYGELWGGVGYADGTMLEIKINGKMIKKELPLEGTYRIPAGKYNAVITNELLGIKKKIKFNVEANKRIQIPE